MDYRRIREFVARRKGTDPAALADWGGLELASLGWLLCLRVLRGSFLRLRLGHAAGPGRAPMHHEVRGESHDSHYRDRGDDRCDASFLWGHARSIHGKGTGRLPQTRQKHATLKRSSSRRIATSARSVARHSFGTT